ncbi:hypothetical protein P9112_013826 [Eukaryota sp. TZLM1-RC]
MSIEATLARIASHPGVVGYFVLNDEGVALEYHGIDSTEISSYAHTVHQFATQARIGVRDLDPTNNLNFIRVRSDKDLEIIICPEGEFILAVLQKVSSQP